MEIAQERYVSLTTFRRSGEAVSTPVWIAPLADGRCGFTTGPDSGKVKRIRHDGRVELRPCSMRGEVAEGVAPVAAAATVVDGGTPAYAEVKRAISAKYGIQFKLLMVGAALKRLVGRGGAAEAAVVLTLA